MSTPEELTEMINKNIFEGNPQKAGVILLYSLVRELQEINFSLQSIREEINLLGQVIHQGNR
jgi:hypothetical protein